MPILPRRIMELALVTLASAMFAGGCRAGNIAETWTRRYEAAVSGSAAALDGAGNVLVIVSMSSGNHFQIHAAKYAAATGAILWEKTIAAPGATDTVEAGVVADAAGNALVGAWTNVSGSSAFYTFKLAATDGALLWDKLNAGPEHTNERAWAIAVDANGNPIVAGNSQTATGGLDAYTVKYAASDGTVLWEHRFDGATHQMDQIYSVAVDPAGNVAVTGSTFSGTQFDVYTGRYAGNNGVLLWEKIYGAPTGGDDIGLSVATDSAGNVAIAGEIELAIDDGPIGAYTAKYAAADGHLLWERSLIVPGSDSGMESVAVDGQGNVLTAGYITQPGQIDLDFYTAKYAANDGAILWEKTYDDSGHGHDQAFDISLDAAGNAVVVGESDNETSPGHPDFQTIKYASANGATLWERRYNGPGEADDRLALTLGRGKVLATVDGGAVVAGLSSTTQTQAAVTIKYTPDNVTEVPLLTAPASGSFNKNPVTVTYTLPEAALLGSVKLTFEDVVARTLVVSASGESAGTHTFAFDPAAPTEGGAIASGAPIPMSYYNVTLSFQDAQGNPAVSSATAMGVTIDTVAPEVILPRLTKIHTADPAGAAFAYEIIAFDLLDSAPTVSANPPSGSVFPVGTTEVEVTATDDSGNVKLTSFPVEVVLVDDVSKPLSTVLAVKGGPVPAAAGSGIPPNSSWLNFSIPSIHGGGAFIGFSATIRTPEGNVTGVFDGPPDAPVLLVKRGDAVPLDETGTPLTGVTIASYKTPIFPVADEELSSTLLATLAGPGVTSANDTAILIAFPGNTPVMIAREGGLAPNALFDGNTEPVGTFKTFTSVAMPADHNTVWFTATLAPVGNVTSANDTGLWVRGPQGTRLILREGSPITGVRTQKVTGIRALEPVVGSPGHGRYGANFVGVQVSLDDGSESIFNVEAQGGIENDISTSPVPDLPGVSTSKLGSPNWRQTGSIPAVLLATLTGSEVSAANNKAILEYPNVIARKGDPTGLSDGTIFKAFKEPVTGHDQDGFGIDAFPATLAGGGTNSGNDASLWWWHGAAPTLQMLAREGGAAPGGGRWRSFNSLTTIEGRGPAFTASLAVDGSTVTSANDNGVWAINSAGSLKPLFREGDVINGRTLSSFNVLGIVNGSPGQRRAWTESNTPALAWRAFFTDGSSAIVKTTVP